MQNGNDSVKRPNILFIMADQLSALALPSYGHPLVKTPNIASLAENGAVFENAYCNFPICAPSRFSMLSGRLGSSIGAYDNAAEFPSSQPTFAHSLRSSGYRTVLSGKMHFVGADQLHGFEERLTTDIYPADFGWTPDWSREPTHYTWSQHMASVVEAGPVRRSLQMDFDEDATYQAVRKIYDLARDPEVDNFFLTVSLTHPHDPYNCLPEHWALYADEDIDMPSVPAIKPEDMDPHSRRLYYQASMNRYDINEERIRNARHAYYGMVSYVDDKVGQLLQALEATGLADDTIVVFTADHGEMLGERGLWYKMTFFEWSARVPLIFHWPQRWMPQRISQGVSLLDIMPTLHDIAGCTAEDIGPAKPEGTSLLPALEGRSWTNDDVRVEYLSEAALDPRLMVRRGDLKYVFSQTDPIELYDLAEDPHELLNLAGNPDYAEQERVLHEAVMARWKPDELKREVMESQQRRLYIHRTLTTGRYTPWDFQPQMDASRAYVRNLGVDEDTLKARSRLPKATSVEPDFEA